MVGGNEEMTTMLKKLSKLIDQILMQNYRMPLQN
jgi:hypothetical protein